jgi:hypothetical protein
VKPPPKSGFSREKGCIPEVEHAAVISAIASGPVPTHGTTARGANLLEFEERRIPGVFSRRA